jgi:DNA mismatch repair protein MutS
MENTDHDSRRRISLLWPKGSHTNNENSFVLGGGILRDLELEIPFRTIAASDQQYMEISHILLKPSRDPAVISYRQDIMDDLLRLPALRRVCREILPALETLRHSRLINQNAQNELYLITSRLSELESYMQCVKRLHEEFGALDRPPAAEGWRKLEETVTSLFRDETFTRLAREVPELVSRLRGIRSVTIGVNLDKNLLPRDAALVAVNKEHFTNKGGDTVLGRLFGDKHVAGESLTGLMHSVPRKQLHTPHGLLALDSDLFGHAANPLMVPLFNDLNNVMRKTAAPIGRAVKQFMSVHTAVLGDLKPEIVFYLGACDMVERLKAAGLPVARPEIRPEGERTCRVKNAYNVNLAFSLLAGGPCDLAGTIVTNDVSLDDEGRVVILTGPNRGGKTTYLQAVGLCQVLAQLGLPVPGEEAAVSPADGIFTHFPTEEKIDSGTGRLGDEARRIGDIFSRLTDKSLILLNETLSSTSAGESFFIARDVVRVLAGLGTRCIYSTHLHELAAAVDQLNRTGGVADRIVSMVALVREEEMNGATKEMTRTYKIVKAPAAGFSYAREIAERYGVSYKQLVDGLRGRGLAGRFAPDATE